MKKAVSHGAILLLAGIFLAGCSLLPSNKDDYKTSRSVAFLKKPEGILTPRPDTTYRVPERLEDADRDIDEPAPVPPKPVASVDSTPSAAVKPGKPVSPKAPTQANSGGSADKAGPVVTRKEDLPVFVTRQALTDTMVVRKQAAAEPHPQPGKIATEQNWFEVEAQPEKVWSRLVAYWMQRDIPLLESNPLTGRILTDWIPAADGAARPGVRDQFEVKLERTGSGSKITLLHRASQRAALKGGKSEWALLGSDPALQGTEAVRLRSFLTGQ